MINYYLDTNSQSAVQSINSWKLRICKNERIAQSDNNKMIMIIILLIKSIYMLTIQMKPNTNVLLKDMKNLVLNSMKIQKFLLNIQVISRMSIKY